MPSTSEPLDVFELLKPLFYRQRVPSNLEQRHILLAWDAIEIVHSDGFDALFEMNKSLDKYASALTAIGMLAAVQIVNKANNLIPVNLRDNENTFKSSVIANFDELKQLAEAFWNACKNSDAILRQFVIRHAEAFADYIPDLTSDHKPPPL